MSHYTRLTTAVVGLDDAFFLYVPRLVMRQDYSTTSFAKCLAKGADSER